MKIEAIQSEVVNLLQVNNEVSTAKVDEKSFSEMLNSIDTRIEKMAKGEHVELHSLLIDIEKAKLNIEYTVKMKDSIIDAYKEVTRMQV
ncbi:hypothetical protein RN22_01380 [Grimontia sp. AD028]|uniref:Flagellar hook-basal body complex protein FliE n=1 Tax=Grimontia celer TaxID=1796497 RepID=A0A128F8H0_9GAMM|nr:MULTISPECIES: flagellar hook-basal body complex protein FliE [Grimontia]KKD62285.1 hypothetical protein RN22_01380 [Grimontia sp. AD028]CZF82654.1 Flagellar hook-basal body complex protein FliE [Grimontia celer]